MPRLFFGLSPDHSIRHTLVEVSRHAGITDGIPVIEGNLHMTVQFLGAVAMAQQEQLINTAAWVSVSSFTLLIDRSGWWSRPRILWLAPGEVPEALMSLHTAIGGLMEPCGIPVEARPYTPHITLARKVNRAINLEFEPIQWRVNEFYLFESITHSGYVEYQIIQRWPLT